MPGTVVVKLGSSIVAGDRGDVRADVLGRICDEVAELHHAGRSVIVVTSDEREETAQEAYYEGATDLVTKPVDAADLIARVQEALGLAAA
jgi:DNA-binding response OmpR family regulator